MKKKLIIVAFLQFACNSLIFSQVTPKIYIAFLWHMHQPIYFPGEDVVQTASAGHYSYNLYDIFNQRYGPYTHWPKNAVMKGVNAGMTHFGAQVSFSGSLIENLNRLEQTGNGNFINWKNHWNYIKSQQTSLGNPRIDMVGFGHHHPLMGLIGYDAIRKQIQMHKSIMAAQLPGTYSKGMFPPENAFALHMIPALTAEGIEWVMVDNIHFDRTCTAYPYSTSGNMYEPNGADILNPNPGDWKALTNLWAPTPVSAAWGHRPHYARYTDPATGQSSKIIVVPTSRYLGNEDGMGGFGALQYETVMSQLESYNTDASHPILIVLHHDGDNYGGGSDSYYNNNFDNFVSWLQSNSNRFVCTTVQDYLEMFPPDTNDIIHVESGSWSGADNGDPQFRKWLGEPNTQGYSPDRNSWGVITAATNIVKTAQQIAPSHANMQNAWKNLMLGQTSCYWYWDFSQNGIWDTHPTRAANMAVNLALPVIQSGTDNTAPEIFHPQRKPYNPGGKEFNVTQTSDVKIWTYVFDKSGLQSVVLKYRTDNDGVNSMGTTENETYAGGSGVSAWQSIPMNGVWIAPQTSVTPLYKAKEYGATISGLSNTLIDYYVEATDSLGHTARSIIQHVYIGNSGSQPQNGITWTPVSPTLNDTILITVHNVNTGGKLHWGVNNWQQPLNAYWPSNTNLHNGTGPAVQSLMAGPDSSKLTIKIGPFNNTQQVVQDVDFVIAFNNNTWDNNNGQDYHIYINNNPTSGSPLLSQSVAFSASLFPNPVADALQILTNNASDSNLAVICDLLGHEVLRTPLQPYKTGIDVSFLENGMYFVILYGSDKTCHKVLKFIKTTH